MGRDDDSPGSSGWSDDLSAFAHEERGLGVIEVPAGPHLYDVYDRFLQHRRRYALFQVVTLVEPAGFTVAERSHLGCFVYPGFAFVKRRNRRRMAARHGPRAPSLHNSPPML